MCNSNVCIILKFFCVERNGTFFLNNALFLIYNSISMKQNIHLYTATPYFVFLLFASADILNYAKLCKLELLKHGDHHFVSKSLDIVSYKTSYLFIEVSVNVCASLSLSPPPPLSESRMYYFPFKSNQNKVNTIDFV